MKKRAIQLGHRAFKFLQPRTTYVNNNKVQIICPLHRHKLFLTQFMKKCRQCTVCHFKKHEVKIKAFLYSVKHNDVKVPF